MQKKKRNLFYAEEGVMALEACISLTLFLIAMVALYSLINMFTAQSMISHALQQTGQSIALENYKNSKTDVKTLQKLPLSLLQKFTDGIGASSDSKYDGFYRLSVFEHCEKKVCILSGRKYGKRR